MNCTTWPEHGVVAKRVGQLFDRHASRFDRWFSANENIYLSELRALQAAKPAGVTLDLGVGSGVFAAPLKVTLGVDVSLEMLKKSKSRSLETLQADVSRLPLRDTAFDTVISSFTICFVDDVAALLSEARRVLKRKGRLILGEITKDSEWGKAYEEKGRRGHTFHSIAHFFGFAETVGLLSAAGFKVENVVGTLAGRPEEQPGKAERPVGLTGEEEAKGYGFVVMAASRVR